MEKMIPHNIEAEESVLGSILIDPEAIAQVADFLRPSDFYREAHRLIFSAMLKLYERHEPADFITLSEELERREELDSAGGMSSLSGLINAPATSSNIEHYGRIVSRMAVFRRLTFIGGQIAGIGYAACNETAEEAIEQAETLLYALDRPAQVGGFASLSDIMREYVGELDELHENRGKPMGVSTGYTDVERFLNGMQKSDLILLGGRPGSGKTALGTNIAYNAARNGSHVAVFELEMSRQQLAMRLMSMETGIDSQRLQDGWIRDEWWEKIAQAGGKLADLPIWINDAPGNPLVSMRSQLRRLDKDHGIDLVIVDYLQLIESATDGKNRHENRVQEISSISRGLKRIAKEFQVPVLALAQLSRKVEERSNKIPILSDLRESGSLEQDADKVMFMYREDYYAEQERRESSRPGIADVVIAKNRNGRVGVAALRFDAPLTKFSTLELTQSAPPVEPDYSFNGGDDEQF